MIVVSLILPLSLVGVVFTSSNALAKRVLALPVQLLICSFGFLSVFCTEDSASKSCIVVPLTINPAPCLCKLRGSLVDAW